ncbi:nucleotidyltransferase domain-containing protein [Isoptericola variabilis]|uniref:DNA polymerase beta domain protein region n=1 Tax=Isoptericola variabilis (strain 225) TaxID=743718 RepID=F6FPI9_ISOV2|nr:DNA polymerase beta domain protein region [Isoptericola variabilis 225]TWH27382.1 streptomycin 3'-adenylyltransferase [Isoptericola variabilis J7]
MTAALEERDRAALRRLVDLVDRTLGDDRLATHLTGSAVDGGLRPDIDLDLLVVTSRAPSDDARARLVHELLRVSGRRAEAGPARPVELTLVVRSAVVPWRYPPRLELQYGEWLRDGIDTDVAADHLLGLPGALTGPERAALLLARDAYRGERADDGRPWPGDARAFAEVAARDFRALTRTG